MKYKNLTPHIIRTMCEDDILGDFVTEYNPEPVRAEAAQIEEVVGRDNGIPFKTISYGEITGLPPQEPGVLLIVSVVIMMHPSTQHRLDLISPDGGPTAIRRDGQVYAVRSFKARSGVSTIITY